MLVVPGTHLSPHHAAAGPDASVPPVLAVALPALPEPQQPPRSAPPVDTVNHESGLGCSAAGDSFNFGFGGTFLSDAEWKMPHGFFRLVRGEKSIKTSKALLESDIE